MIMFSVRRNPQYVKLEEEILDLNQKLFQLEDKIMKHKRVEERLTVCLERTENIEDYIKDNHVGQ